MGWFQHIVGVLRRILPGRASRPEDIPRKLDPDTLARVHEEAGKLRTQFQVQVEPMSVGELPIPRRADDV